MSINDDRVGLKCSSTDKDRWKEAADLDNRSLSNWIITRLNECAEREIAEAESDGKINKSE